MPRHTTSVLPAPLTHSLTRSFIHSCTHIRRTQSIYTHEQPMEFFFPSPHFSKGSLALKGNLLFLLQEFSSFFFLLCSKTQHTMNAVHDHGAYCVRKRHIFPVPWAAHLHSHPHTHTYKHTEGICEERS